MTCEFIFIQGIFIGSAIMCLIFLHYFGKVKAYVEKKNKLINSIRTICMQTLHKPENGLNKIRFMLNNKN